MNAAPSSPNVGHVRDFWNARPCQADLSTASDRREYFEEISRRRYGGREWHVPTVAKFGAYAGRRVLEIGCGIATDGLEFARRGAVYTGVDLTPEAIRMAVERFSLFGVEGRLLVANAEHRLPFDDGAFDHVYSFGVIHHSPVPERIVAEIHRVLKPGGTFTLMLYNRSSINYYLEIMCLRRLFRWLLLPSFMPRVLASVTGFDRWKLEGHRELLKGTMTKEQWVSRNTDGPFCPLARVYGARDAAALLSSFVNVEQEVWEFNPEHWSVLGRMIPTGLERWLGHKWGWHRMVYGEKAPA